MSPDDDDVSTWAESASDLSLRRSHWINNKTDKNQTLHEKHRITELDGRRGILFFLRKQL